jgi:FlaA1/EpsC-like NDP-sugar epimerase
VSQSPRPARLERLLGPQNVARAKFGLDLAAMLVAVPVAYALRLESLGDLEPYAPAIIISTLALLPVAVALELRLGLHRQVWRRVSFPDLAGLGAAAAAIGVTLGLVQAALALLVGPTPRSVPLLASLIAAAGLAAPRLGRRGQLARIARSSGPRPAGRP